MPDEWRDVLLEDLAAPVRNALVGGPFGSDLVSSDYEPAGIPVIRGENLSDGRWVRGDFVFVSIEKAKKLEANTASALDIIFTQRGANHYRQVAVVPANEQRRFVISQSQMKLTVNRRLADPMFVYYAFRAPKQQEYLLRNAIQTGVPHTNLSILRKTPLRIPSVETQSGIARILGELDDKIELNRRMNETLEAMARALFKSWFVDFDPVRAKAEGRNAGLPEPIADLFPTRLVDSELGEIPEGWQLGSLETTAELLRAQVNPLERLDQVFSHYSIPAFDNGQLPLSEEGIAIKSVKFCVPAGTVLFSKLNPTIERAD
jgi:type I restriction enzyme, S subunit